MGVSNLREPECGDILSKLTSEQTNVIWFQTNPITFKFKDIVLLPCYKFSFSKCLSKKCMRGVGGGGGGGNIKPPAPMTLAWAQTMISSLLIVSYCYESLCKLIQRIGVLFFNLNTFLSINILP